MRRGAPPAGPALAALAGAAVLASLATVLWRFTVDDSFITLRYARNLARGLGPTFNATGPRAEGYSSPLWTLLLALPHALGLDALVFAKIAGLLCALATLALVAMWAARESESPGGALRAGSTAALLLAALPATTVHAVSGMETSLFTLVLTALFACAASAVRSAGGRAFGMLPVLALLVSFARPEGALAALVVLVVAGRACAPAMRGGFLRAALLVWALPLALHEGARLAWYGLPFPLPFYVKLAAPGRLPGGPVVAAWLGDHARILGLPLALALAPPPRALRPALALFFLVPQHLMGYEHRYLAPLDPAVCVLAAIGLDRLAVRVARLGRARIDRLAGFALAAVPFVLAGFELAGVREVVRERLEYADGLAAAHEPLGRALAGVVPHGRLALSDAGAAPYLSDWWTLDLLGLDDAHIATTGDRRPRTILAQRPDVLVLVSREPGRFLAWNWNAWEAPLFESARAAGFARACVLRFGPDYWLWVLARPGSPASRALESLPEAQGQTRRSTEGSARSAPRMKTVSGRTEGIQ